MAEVSPELDALTCDLIGEAINFLEMDGVLPVILISDASDDLYAFEDDDADGCYRAACMQVQEFGAKCSMYAIAYEGVVQEDETGSGEPAIIFEFAQRGTGEAWSGYLLFRINKDGSVDVTDPMPGGAEEPLFA